MENIHRNFIHKSKLSSQQLLALLGDLVQLDILWAGSPNFNGDITQQDLDTEYPGSEFTTVHLADAEFALAAVKTAIQGALPALTRVANLP